ncbi:MAG: hypothetical protein V7707_09260 [Motiliproteus sp.]
MTLISLITCALSRINRRASEHLTYQQVRHLPPHLLSDIGLKLENNRVVPLQGVVTDTLQDQVSAPEQCLQSNSPSQSEPHQGVLPPVSQPKASSG